MSPTLQAELPREVSAARAVRRLLDEHFASELDELGLGTAKLLATELVNNAVLHGEGEIGLKAELDADRLRVDVIDQGTRFERELRKTDLDALGGRGLQIVETQSSRWGVFEGTTHVWFELERPGPRLGPESDPG